VSPSLAQRRHGSRGRRLVVDSLAPDPATDELHRLDMLPAASDPNPAHARKPRPKQRSHARHEGVRAIPDCRLVGLADGVIHRVQQAIDMARGIRGFRIGEPEAAGNRRADHLKVQPLALDGLRRSPPSATA
jgi:hypothetical protein